MKTVVTALRGLDTQTITKLYYETSIPSHDDWVKQVKALAFNFEPTYSNIIKELETITLRYLAKCNVSNYTKMKCALTQYLYDKFIVPKQVRDWNPNVAIAVTEMVSNPIKEIPTVENYWDMKYNG